MAQPGIIIRTRFRSNYLEVKANIVIVFREEKPVLISGLLHLFRFQEMLLCPWDDNDLDSKWSDETGPSNKIMWS